jgi:hypothetical protein
LVIAYEFREGADSGGKLRILKKALARCREESGSKRFFLDAEYYTNDVIDYLKRKEVRWVICVDKVCSVMEAIGGFQRTTGGLFESKMGS